MFRRCFTLHQFDQIPLTWRDPSLIGRTLSAEGFDAITFKTHQATTWLGRATSGDKSSLAIRDLDGVRRTVDAFRGAGLTPIPWCVPEGTALDAEAALAAEIAKVAGAIALDLEVYPGFWDPRVVDPALITSYLERLRAQAPGAQLFAWIDSRAHQLTSLKIHLWAHLVDQIWSQDYWTDFQLDPLTVLTSARRRLEPLGKPVVHTLPANGQLYHYDQVADYLASTSSQLVAWVLPSAPAIRAKIGAIPLQEDDVPLDAQDREDLANIRANLAGIAAEPRPSKIRVVRIQSELGEYAGILARIVGKLS